MCGYKFCIGIDANGRGFGRGKATDVYLWAMQGEYDHQLKWPAKVTFTIELLHQQGQKNAKHTTTREWKKVKDPYIWIGEFVRRQCGVYWAFLEHYELESFLKNDTLYFCLSNIIVS